MVTPMADSNYPVRNPLYRDFDTYEAQVVAIAPFDATTGAALVMETVHHEVHEGEMFHAAYTNGSVANGANLDLQLTTGAKEAHTTWEVFAGGQVTVSLYEAPTTSGGTAVTAYNLKRSSTNTPTGAVAHTPTVTATGTVTLVNGRILPGGNSPQTRVGGGIRSGAEWILKPATKYLMRVNNSSGSTIAVNCVLEWYEEAV